jgi:DNA polymerase-1
MNRADGVPVNAVFGFTNMLAKFLREHVGTHIAVIFDAGRATFRDRIYDQYKAHRPDPPDDLLPQFPLVREATAAFGVPAIELADWEADDLIASYARAAVAAGGRVTIASSDKDLMQLIGPGIDMLDPIRGKPIGPAEVMEKFGVPPEKLIEVQALMGDSIDNVPGVPGIGPKNAAQLIQEFGDLETVLAAAPAMKPSKRRDNLIAHAENARLSRTLVTLRDDAPLPMPMGELACCEPDRDALAAFLRRNGFRSVLLRMGLEQGSGAPPAPAAQPDPEQQPSPPKPAREKKPFGPYQTVTTPEALQAWIAEAKTAGLVAIGVVADSADPLRANLVGLALAIAPGRACYVPVQHTVLEAQLSPAHVLAALPPIFADPGVLKVFHDAKLAMLVLARAGAGDIAPVDDTMLISYAQDAGAHGHELDELSVLHLGHQPAGIEQVTGSGRSRVAFADAPLERATAHAAEAADITLRLWRCARFCARKNRWRITSRSTAAYCACSRRWKAAASRWMPTICAACPRILRRAW